MNDHFCKMCNNMRGLKVQEDGGIAWRCYSCGEEKAQEGGCLLMETMVQERASESFKILPNEFTRQDPTLPHVKNIKCPNSGCASNTGGAERDVIYMKYDTTNMKFIYMCNVCKEATWRSR